MIKTVITHAEVVAIVNQGAAEFGRFERTNRKPLTALERLHWLRR